MRVNSQWGIHARNAFFACGIVAAGAAKGHGAGNGAQLYKEMCVVCHGEDGKSATQMGKTLKAAVLSSPAVQKETEETLAKVITSGKEKMPAIGNGLKPEEVKSLVVYVRTLGKSTGAKKSAAPAMEAKKK